MLALSRAASQVYRCSPLIAVLPFNKFQQMRAKSKVISKKQQKKRDQFENAYRTQLDLFHHYYVSYFGEERLPRLIDSLRKPTKYVALMNKFTDPAFSQALVGVGTSTTAPFHTEFFSGIIAYQHIDSESLTPKESVADVGDSAPPVPTEEATKPLTPHQLKMQQRLAAKAGPPQSKNATKAKSSASKGSSDEQQWPAPGAASSLCPVTGLCCYYPLDAASLFPVEALDIQPHHHVLDLCAAPGGKTLTIIQKLDLSGGLRSGSLTCNDVSPDRRTRLKNVIRRYVPSQFTGEGSRIDVVGFDGSTRRLVDAIGENRFDRVLLDAPCSSERHLLQEDAAAAALSGGHGGSTEFMQWAPGRARSNADRQFSLLWNAVKVCRINGLIVYSTCALSSVENDDVIAKLLRKLQGGGVSASGKVRRTVKVARSRNGEGYSVESLALNPEAFPCGEATRFGWHILPDHDPENAWGPIYLSVLRKVAFEPTTNDDDDDDDEDEDSNSGDDSEYDDEEHSDDDGEEEGEEEGEDDVDEESEIVR